MGQTKIMRRVKNSMVVLAGEKIKYYSRVPDLQLAWRFNGG
jgi:hypothetical protein